MSLRSYSGLDILLPPISIMMQYCSQALSTYAASPTDYLLLLLLLQYMGLYVFNWPISV